MSMSQSVCVLKSIKIEIDNVIVVVIIITNIFLLKLLMKRIIIIIKYIDITNKPVLLPVNNNAPTASIKTIYE